MPRRGTSDPGVEPVGSQQSGSLRPHGPPWPRPGGCKQARAASRLKLPSATAKDRCFGPWGLSTSGPPPQRPGPPRGPGVQAHRVAAPPRTRGGPFGQPGPRRSRPGVCCAVCDGGIFRAAPHLVAGDVLSRPRGALPKALPGLAPGAQALRRARVAVARKAQVVRDSAVPPRLRSPGLGRGLRSYPRLAKRSRSPGRESWMVWPPA